jgi:hypothetical protein
MVFGPEKVTVVDRAVAWTQMRYRYSEVLLHRNPSIQQNSHLQINWLPLQLPTQMSTNRPCCSPRLKTFQSPQQRWQQHIGRAPANVMTSGLSLLKGYFRNVIVRDPIALTKPLRLVPQRPTSAIFDAPLFPDRDPINELDVRLEICKWNVTRCPAHPHAFAAVPTIRWLGTRGVTSEHPCL